MEKEKIEAFIRKQTVAFICSVDYSGIKGGDLFHGYFDSL